MKINLYFFLHNLHIIHTNSHVEPHRVEYIVIFFVLFKIVDLIYNIYTGQMSIPSVCKLLCLHDFLISAENLLPVSR